MNYPYDQHNTSSQNSRNQFILSQSSLMMNSGVTRQNNVQGNNDIDKIFSYMKNVMSNPMLMDQMEKFLAAKQQQKNSSFVLKHNQSLSSSRMDNQIRQSPQSYGIQQSDFIHKQLQPHQTAANPYAKKIIKTSQIASNSINRKKSDDGLMAYINIETSQNVKTIDNNKKSFQNGYDEQRVITVKQKKIIKNQQKLPVQPLKPPASFEDMPIKSNYIANKQLDNFDSVQNRLASYPQNSSQFYESSQLKKITNKTTTTSTKNNSNNNLEKYVEAEERPINGTKKDFKELLKQQFGQTPFDQKPIPTIANNSNKWNELEQYDNENNQNDQNNQDSKPKKQFLKRGSRQYLSSAKDKKQVKKPVKIKDSQQNLNSSRLGINKTQRDKTPTKRDVSQNRILSKRNTATNDKSISKIKAKDKLNTSNNDSYYDQRQQEEPQKHIIPKNDKGNQKNKNSILPPKSNKPTNTFSKTQIPNSGNIESGKKKNVFDDSSSSEESQQKHEFSNNQQEQQSQIKNKFMNGKKQIKNGSKKVQPYQPEKQFNMFSRQKKQEVIEGVYLSKNQLNIIIQRYAPKVQPVTQKNTSNSQQKFNQLRKKYTDLCNLLEKQKIEHQQQMQKEKQQFQIFKQQQIQKLKNQKRVMQRQIKSSMPSHSQNLQKVKEQVQNLKKQLEKEREEHKKKEKNNKILIQKYKKENQDMKFRIEKLEQQLQKQSASSVQNNLSSANSEKQTNYSSANAKSGSANDKSKSKVAKDLSPAKNKMNKSSKTVQINQDEDKNYQKTIPLYKGSQPQNKLKTSNQNKKKIVNGSKNFEDDNNSEDDKLPTFKIDNKKKQEETKSVKTHKKYQYIQNSVETTQNKKDSQSLHSKTSSNYQSKGSSKNVFADDSDEQKYHQNEQINDNSDEQSGHQSGFFKSQPKYQKLSDLMNVGFSIKHVTDEMIQNLLRYDSNEQYSKYLQRVNNPKRIIVNSSKNGVDKKITNIYNDKSKQILFQNGVKKQIFEDGYTIIYFKNGDIKQKLTDGTTLYYFNDKKVDQFTLINGLNIYRFDNNQIQVHYDGNYIEIRHPDGTIKMLGSPIH